MKKRTTVQLDQEDIVALDEICKNTDRTRAYLIRAAIKMAIRQAKEKKDNLSTVEPPTRSENRTYSPHPSSDLLSQAQRCGSFLSKNCEAYRRGDPQKEVCKVCLTLK